MESIQHEINYEVVKSADTDEVIGLYKEGGWWKESPEGISTLPLLIANSFCFIIARNHQGKIIGMGRVISDGVSDGYIQDVIISQSYRNKGIGKQLVKNLRDYCLDKGLSWIGLIAEPGTTAFYNKLGFSEMMDYKPMILDNK